MQSASVRADGEHDGISLEAGRGRLSDGEAQAIDVAARKVRLADGRLITQQLHSVEDVYGRPVGQLWLFQDVTRERQTADQSVPAGTRCGRNSDRRRKVDCSSVECNRPNAQIESCAPSGRVW